MERAVLVRTEQTDKYTRGYLLYGDLDLVTLELPWRNNQRRVSCIPEGNYTCVRHNSPTFGECFWVKDVPGRSEILIHAGNFTDDTLGCPLVGLDFADINKDGIPDIINSKKAMDILLKNMPDQFTLHVSSL